MDDETFYTIESDAGTYVSADPSTADSESTQPPSPDRKVAWLFHDSASASQIMEGAGHLGTWHVQSVQDLDAWLDSLLGQDITHVVEFLQPDHLIVRATASWLLMHRAQESGRQYRKPQ